MVPVLVRLGAAARPGSLGLIYLVEVVLSSAVSNGNGWLVCSCMNCVPNGSGTSMVPVLFY